MVRIDILHEWLKQLDETQLCELLDISSEDIIARFNDLIITRRKYIEKEMEVLDSSIEDEELDFEED